MNLSLFNKKAAVMAMLLIVSSGLAFAASPPLPFNLTGTFPDGQPWQITVPANWNGTVINDLDRVGNTSRANFFLPRGYAYTGTRRHPDRDIHWNKKAETDNNAEVVNMFEALFGRPKHAIQFGCSGGGSTALSEAEDHPSRFDGVIALHASDVVALNNMRLDLTFALKALLDPNDELPLIGIDYSEVPAADAAWLAFLTATQQTAVGRARMALAVVLAQYPVWGSYNQPPANERPEPRDKAAIEAALLRAVVDAARRAVAARPQADTPPGGMASWTTGIDYRRFWTNANPNHVQIVRDMYAQAGLHLERDIQADLDRINATPRIAASQDAVNYWRPTVPTGKIWIPTLHASSIGDAGTNPAVMAPYTDAVHWEGRNSLYRLVFYDAPGHCTFNNAELAAMIATMEKRIETGRWGNITTASEMNALGRSFGLGEPRFIEDGVEAGWTLPNTPNRAFYRDSEVPNP